MTSVKAIGIIVAFVVFTLAITTVVGYATSLLWPSIAAWTVGLFLNLGFFIYMGKKESK